MEQLEGGEQQSAPVWAIFSDLMAALVGILALILVWVIGIQLELSQSLAEEIEKREAEEQRRMALEQALEDPLTKGLVTFRDGRIGISGNVLFELNSDQLQAEGEEVLESLIRPLQAYLEQHDELLMVSGFTDDLPMHPGNRYQDNWGLSAQRALTVTRTLTELGLPNDRVFAAAFGPHHPAVPNVDAESRAQNRRVEISTVPRAPSSAEDTETGEGD
ncbi:MULTISPECIES: OmpA family protein [Marinobacter]|jgi:flagellar motor protein MotB|uniref:OmpA family protein n=4 Tax=Marinobacter TaxID=2742 RepID=A0A368UU52_MARNT|nr:MULTISPECIES: OmpA family protein [Marinobacter]ABM20103.1 OmpA/MotB domain protein [Marinobacter nauticus VT8]ERS85780.1 membrane protein [Marinobacter sp. EVN1]ERS85995.1 membrane protein [Marinobacter sp. C1S70]MBN8238982.1 OmpA family protein [Marinobacter nauticus]MBY5936433.1 OmpA family protein [Marinobacter nauticus]